MAKKTTKPSSLCVPCAEPRDVRVNLGLEQGHPCTSCVATESLI